MIVLRPHGSKTEKKKRGGGGNCEMTRGCWSVDGVWRCLTRRCLEVFDQKADQHL
ncbi:hypothetical protein HanIR_Chr08g0357461 [Helianthus annuus]|nr:hypothetical protein HanIR_Chr08g0357461 [Helianthus annuus]